MENEGKKLIEEEQKILDSLIFKMDQEILRLNTKWDQKSLEEKKQKEQDLPETYGALVQAEDDKKWIASESETLQQSRDALYSYRLMLTVEDKDGTNKRDSFELKIGLHTYSKNGDILICSWKQPVCRNFLFNNKSTKFEGVVEDKNGKYEADYTLNLKRKVDLDFEQVVNVSQLYPNISLNDNIIYDEFLNDLLERRSETEFRNIVFSIQKKQGEIIEVPFSQDLIVQGCAGSGKSMIMLHRLPVLLYDNQNSLDIANIYVITPSESYIQMAQSMLRQLEISDIPMGTLEEYYVHLLSKYGRNLEECGKESSLEKLSPEQEQYIYSKKCIGDISIFLITEIEKKKPEYEEAVSCLSLQKELDEKIDFDKERTCAEEISKNLVIFRRIIEANSERFRSNHARIYQSIAAVSNLKSALETFLKGRNENVLSAGSQMLDTENYKISIMQRRLSKLELDPQNHAKEINELQRHIIDQQAGIIDLLEERVESAESESYYLKLEKLIAELDDVLNIYSDFKYNFDEYDDRKEFYDIFSRKEIFAYKYEQAAKDITKLMSSSADYQEKISSYLEEANLVVPQMIYGTDTELLSEEYIEKVSDYISCLEGLQKDLVIDTYKNIISKIEQPDKNGNYKRLNCSSYLFLQALYQYQGAPNARAESLVAIDEAQSVAVEEIRLIKKINRNNVVLNLYGDIKQHFENDKGIDDWSALNDTIDGRIFDLNENYRNSRQITEYCNRRFKTNMIPINIDGDDVERNPESGLLNQILAKPIRDGLYAIIVADDPVADFIAQEFQRFIPKRINWNKNNFKLNEKKWNLMTVDQAKGLEFRTAIVIDSHMSENQKYVAYTRALDKLYIYDIATINLEEPYRSEVKEFFENAGLKVVDKRQEGGSLWVVGDEDHIGKYVLGAIKKFGISGRYSKGKAIDFQEGWYTKTEK